MKEPAIRSRRYFVSAISLCELAIVILTSTMADRACAIIAASDKRPIISLSMRPTASLDVMARAYSGAQMRTFDQPLLCQRPLSDLSPKPTGRVNEAYSAFAQLRRSPSRLSGRYSHTLDGSKCEDFSMLSIGAMFDPIAQQIHRCRDAQSLVDCLLYQGLELSRARFGNVQLMNWKVGYLEIKAQSGFGDEFLNFFKRVYV